MPLVHCQTLDEVRAQIEKIDEKLVELLAERLQYVKMAGRFRKHEYDADAASRVKKTLARVRAMAKSGGTDADAVEKVYLAVIEALIKEEMRSAPKNAL